MGLKLIFKTSKETGKTQLAGQTTKEGKELDKVLRGITGTPSVKNKEGDFTGTEFIAEAFDKDEVKQIIDDDLLDHILYGK